MWLVWGIQAYRQAKYEVQVLSESIVDRFWAYDWEEYSEDFPQWPTYHVPSSRPYPIAVAGLPSVPPAVWGHDQPARTEGAQVKCSGHSLGCFEMLRFPKMGVPPNHPFQ